MIKEGQNVIIIGRIEGLPNIKIGTTAIIHKVFKEYCLLNFEEIHENYQGAFSRQWFASKNVFDII